MSGGASGKHPRGEKGRHSEGDNISGGKRLPCTIGSVDPRHRRIRVQRKQTRTDIGCEGAIAAYRTSRTRGRTAGSRYRRGISVNLIDGACVVYQGQGDTLPPQYVERVCTSNVVRARDTNLHGAGVHRKRDHVPKTIGILVVVEITIVPSGPGRPKERLRQAFRLQTHGGHVQTRLGRVRHTFCPAGIIGPNGDGVRDGRTCTVHITGHTGQDTQNEKNGAQDTELNAKYTLPTA